MYSQSVKSSKSFTNYVVGFLKIISISVQVSRSRSPAMCWVYVGTVCCYKVFMVVVQLLLLVAWEEFTVVMVWYYNLCGAKAPLHTGFFHPRISQNIHCCCIHCILYSWSIDNNFVIGFYCRCQEILCQIAFSIVHISANYFISYRKKQFGIKSVGIYSRRL